MITTDIINVDLASPGAGHVVNVVQNDKYSRNIVANLYFNGSRFLIPDGTTVVASYNKPDGTGGIYDSMPDESIAWEIDGNSVTVALAPQVLTVAGMVNFSITLIQGKFEISVFRISIHVHPLPGFTAQSEDYVNMRDWLSEELDKALEEAKESGEFNGANGYTPVKGKDYFDGKSAYQYAQDGGYTGTEEEFAEKLAKGYSGVTVADYGAKGDGATDDTTAFQTALAGNRVVLVPGGTYKLSGELVIGDNCCFELSQDTVLEFTQTTGNCINLGLSSNLKGNHATVKVPYVFDGHVLHAYSNDSTSVDIQAVPPWSKWDPQWKTGRYVSDLNICKADNRGLHYCVNEGECKGTAVYISAKNTVGLSTFMWGVHYTGLRIAGAFAYGIHAQNFNNGWLHEMRIDGFIDACEIGVCLEDCQNTYISAIIQPRRGYTEDKVYFPYAKNGIKLVRSKNTDLSGSRVWDWNTPDNPSTTENEKTTLYEVGNEYQHIAMYGNCSGTILNDYTYHDHGDTRSRIYTDDDHNLETLTILQEPIDRWFKVIGGEPYYTDGLTDQKLLKEDALDAFVYVDSVKNFTDVLAAATDIDGVTVFNDIGYQVGKRFASLGTGTDLADSVYYMTTGFIEVPLGSTIYGKGLHFDDTAKTYAGIVYYNANRERVASMTIVGVVNGNQYYVSNYTRTSDGFSVQIPSSATLSNLGTTYVRMVFPMSCVGDSPMLSINEEIKYTMEGFLADGIKVKGENVIGIPGQVTPDWVATKELAGGDFVYITEQTISSGLWSKLQISLQPGLTYDVTLNGEVYTCQGLLHDGGIILGNNPSLTLNDYPFCISWAGEGATGGMFFKRSDISYPVTLKVTSGSYYVYNKMPEGYLPDCVVKSVNGKAPYANGNVEIEVPSGSGIDVTASVGQTIVVEEVDDNGKPTKWKAAEYQQKICDSKEIVVLEETTIVPADDGSLMFAPLAVPSVGATSKVTYNGIEYVCEAIDCSAMMGMECVAFGNFDLATGTGDTGEPFMVIIVMAGEGGGQLMPMGDLEGSETFVVSIKSETVTKMPYKYIPNKILAYAPYYVPCIQGDTVTEQIPQITVSALESLIDAGRMVIARVITTNLGTFYLHFCNDMTGTDGKRYFGFSGAGYGLKLTPQDDDTYIGELGPIN